MVFICNISMYITIMNVNVNTLERVKGREEGDVLWIDREEEDLETEIECQVSIFCVSNGVAIKEAERTSGDVSQVY